MITAQACIVLLALGQSPEAKVDPASRLIGSGDEVLGGPLNDNEATEMVLGVRVNELLELLNLTAQDATLDARGMGYKVGGSKTFRNIDFLISVHSTVEGARKMFVFRRREFTIGPSRFDEPIGDYRVFWSSAPAATPSDPMLRDHGHLLWRRRNVVLSLNWNGPNVNGVALARDIDDLLRSNREIAPEGEFPLTPEILDAEVRDTHLAQEALELHPSVAGLGNYADIQFAAFRGYQQLSGYRDSPGKLGLTIPRESGATEVLIVAASPLNVFVSKTVTTTVVGGSLRPPLPVLPGAGE